LVVLEIVAGARREMVKVEGDEGLAAGEAVRAGGDPGERGRYSVAGS